MAMAEERNGGRWSPAVWVRERLAEVKVEDKKALWNEISGALGDLGTYIPIVIALALVTGLDVGTTLLFSGMFNIVSGFLFGVPMAVQPMHSIAATAINPLNPFTVPELMAAGLSVSFMLIFLGLTGLMALVNWLVPLPVVRGIQLAQGLNFSLTAVGYILHNKNLATSKVLGNRAWQGLDGRIVAIAAFCFVIASTGVGGEFRSRKKLAEVRAVEEGEGSKPELQAADVQGEEKCSSPRGAVVPAALLLFVLGIALATARRPSVWKSLTVGPAKPRVVHISSKDWKTGLVRGAVPQLPLSMLNSVIAVVKMSHDLFPEKKKLSVMHVATSVGMMNVVGCWFGAMPTCHGCGGLAGQFRFGARTGLAVIMLGAAKIIISLLVGSSLIKLLAVFPVGLLGVLLLFAGIELAMAARDQSSRVDSFIVLLTTAVSLAWSNTAYGFVCGMVVAAIFKLQEVDYRALYKTWVIHSRPPASSTSIAVVV